MFRVTHSLSSRNNFAFRPCPRRNIRADEIDMRAAQRNTSQFDQSDESSDSEMEVLPTS